MPSFVPGSDAPPLARRGVFAFRIDVCGEQGI